MKDKERIEEIRRDFPELTFYNVGYQYLKKDVVEKHKKQIEEIENILSKHIPGFVKFENFRVGKSGVENIRVQYHYSETYVGVGYFPIDEIITKEDD